MFRKSIFVQGMILTVGAAFAQNTVSQTDPYKAYSTIGITRGETLRVNVANIGGTNGAPPDPCNVQMGFVNAAGVLVKSNTASIPAGQAAFLTINYSEGASFTTNADSATRINLRPLVNMIPPLFNTLAPPPCRTVSTAEVFDPLLGRTNAYAVPTETPSMPPPDPDFGIVGVTALDVLRLNITNITGSNGIPPDPCNVQLGFMDALGQTVKTVNGAIDPGHTASVEITYREAANATPSTNMPARFNLRPLVSSPPDPCRITGSAELVDSVTGMTLVNILPAVQSNTAPPGVVGQ